MTLFATSHTAKTLKMKATACRKGRDKIVNQIEMIEICLASRNISPFVSAVKAQLITEY